MPEAARADTSHGINLRALTWVAAALCGIVLLAMAIAYLVWRGASATPPALGANAPAEIRVAGIALESAPRQRRAAYSTEKQRLLQSRTWINAEEGIARIPIDDAMRVLVQRDAQRRAKSSPSQ